jgi:hypothetical protein
MRWRFALLIGTALLLTYLAACGSKPKGGAGKGALMSANLSISSYAEARRRGNAKATSEFFFPMLEIYNGSGALVYRGHESIENARVLRELPSGIDSLLPQQDAPRLSDILEAVPDFKTKEQEILRRRSPVVLSIVLENCKACTVQEDELDQAQQRLLEHSVDVLVVKIAHP